MNISSKEFIQIMSINFGFEIVSTEFGDAIKMNPKDAFIYSNTTGSGYLDNGYYPYTPKGLTKLFYNAFDYNFVTGIFDNLDLRNTPHYLVQQRQYIGKDIKLVLPVEYSSEEEFRNIVSKIFEANNQPQNILIQRIDLSKKGFGMEPFMEYLTCKTFESMGYIVENQIPLTHSTGSPDFGGYSAYELMSSLKAYGGGLNIIELSMIRDFDLSKTMHEPIFDQIIVGEAKTSTKTVLKQVDKYINTHLFDKAYVINPLETEKIRDDLGLVTIDSNFRIILQEGMSLLKDQSKQDNYKNWLINYIKYYLIANLTNDEFSDWYKSEMGSAISSKTDISNFINALTTEEIFSKLKEITNGAI